MNERWSFSGKEVKFNCTVAIFKQGDEYFLASSKDRQHEVVLDALNPTKIPEEDISPLYESSLTEFKNTEGYDVFVKRPRLTGYNGSDSISRTLLAEAQICERLLASPHENIARYHGCITQNGRIVGLCFDRYAETLGQRLERGVKNNGRWFSQIEAGVQHLHRLGLVHCDITDENIMFRDLEGDELVIIDFDACVPDGAPLPAKRGPVPDGIDNAAFSIDFSTVEKYQV